MMCLRSLSAMVVVGCEGGGLSGWWRFYGLDLDVWRMVQWVVFGGWM
jgi:hypothetical protein